MSIIDRTNKSGEASDGMTHAELARYRELLNEAYPCPKQSIRDSVMKTVLAEAKPQKKKSPARSLIMKWGSLAACIVIIGAVCLRVLPQMELLTKDAAMENEYAPNMNGGVESPTEMENAENITEDFALCTLTAITEDGEEYDFMPPTYGMADENLAENENLTGGDQMMPESAPGAKDDACDTAVDCEGEKEQMQLKLLCASPAMSTIPTDCEHSETFMNSYHDIPAQLMNFVGGAEYGEWLSTADGDISCKNIGGFIEHFDIEKWVFDELISSTDMYYLTDYPTELLYSGDDEMIEDYYKNGGNIADCLVRYFEYRYKISLGAQREDYIAWRAQNGFDSVADWSIAQLSHDLKFDADELLAVYGDLKAEFSRVYPDAVVPEYDFEMIAECGVDLRRAIVGGAPGYDVDKMCRK